jgi:quercetin dioxygenase-like cupin family protein
MELIRKGEFKVLSNPGVESAQLLNPDNSTSERVTITRVRVEPGAEQGRHTHDSSELNLPRKSTGTLLLADGQTEEFREGDVARFSDKTVHGLLNETDSVFEYLSVTSPPINFRKAYKEER